MLQYRKKLFWIVAVIILITLIGSHGSFDNGYTINSKSYKDGICYPEIVSVHKFDKIDYASINKAIRDNLFGPYLFLHEDDIAVTMDYEVTLKNKDLLSILYQGIYVFDRNVNQFCFGVTFDMKTQKLLSFEEVVGEEGIKEIGQKILDKDFDPIHGVFCDENVPFEPEEVLNGQPAFAEDNVYNFYLSDKRIQVILIGFPSIAGNYSILALDYQ